MNDIEKPDVIGATRRAETIRIGMAGWAAAQEAIAEAYAANDWMTLGYKSWPEYVDKEFAEKRLKLTRQQRIEAVEAFQLIGMSQREIAKTLDVSRNTVAGDLAPEVAQIEPPADPLAQFPDAKDAIETSMANRSTPADRDPEASPEDSTVATTGQPEEDHPGTANPGDEDGAPTPSDAQPPAGDVSNGAGSDETGADGEAPRLPSAPVAERQQERAGVSAPAAAPERSGWGEGQGPAAASVPAPPRTGETDEERAERENREYREARSLEFAVGLVNVRMRLEPDPVHWYQNVYVHGLYHARDLPRVRDSFTPTGMRQAAGFLLELADHLEQAGEEL